LLFTLNKQVIHKVMHMSISVFQKATEGELVNCFNIMKICNYIIIY
jgi:hypothetical protein